MKKAAAHATNNAPKLTNLIQNPITDAKLIVQWIIGDWDMKSMLAEF